MYNFNKFGCIVVEKIVNKQRFKFSGTPDIFKKIAKMVIRDTIFSHIFFKP